MRYLSRCLGYPLPAALGLLAACSSDPDTILIPPPPPPSSGLLVQGTDMSGSVQNVTVFQYDTAVAHATVVVNGDTMVNNGGGLYAGTISPVVAPGGTVTVVVSAGGLTATGVGTVPSAAVINQTTSTVQGATVGVNWTIASSPDSFLVGLNFSYLFQGYITAQRTSGGSRSALLSSADLPSGAQNLSLTVFGFNTGTFTGDFAPGSNMRVRTLGVDRPFAFGVP